MKPPSCLMATTWCNQPPSGGCVLKPLYIQGFTEIVTPAAFGRLCVETGLLSVWVRDCTPAAFGRLCVETNQRDTVRKLIAPAAFGRLCVETKAA